LLISSVLRSIKICRKPIILLRLQRQHEVARLHFGRACQQYPFPANSKNGKREFLDAFIGINADDIESNRAVVGILLLRAGEIITLLLLQTEPAEVGYIAGLMMIQVFTYVIKNARGVGSLFFGLWLIPMGFIVVHSKRMPLWLSRTLIIGGVGYVASAFLNYAGLTYSWIGALTLPATIGGFWIISYLIVFGIRSEV
jgi:hypothetical protein